MPAFTSPDNIIYPVITDPIEPLNAVFQDLAQSVQDAFTAKIPGDWSTWTPSYENITVGDGVVLANYAQIGKTVYGVFSFELGSTSTIGSSPRISMPIAIEAGSSTIGQVRITDATPAAVYRGAVNVVSGKFAIHAFNSSATYVTETEITAAIPMTWTIGDKLEFYFLYETP